MVAKDSREHAMGIFFFRLFTAIPRLFERRNWRKNAAIQAREVTEAYLWEIITQEPSKAELMLAARWLIDACESKGDAVKNDLLCVEVARWVFRKTSEYWIQNFLVQEFGFGPEDCRKSGHEAENVVRFTRRG